MTAPDLAVHTHPGTYGCRGLGGHAVRTGCPYPVAYYVHFVYRRRHIVRPCCDTCLRGSVAADTTIADDGRAEVRRVS